MKFENQSCPVCEKVFTENDTIVVCPECGTPHHKECYFSLGECKNKALHSNDFSYKPQKNETEKLDVIIEDDVIKYVDYDLDLVKTIKGEIKILDEDEFQENKVRYNYGEDLELILRSELESLKEAAINSELDFNDQQVYDGFNEFWEAFMRHEYDNN